MDVAPHHARQAYRAYLLEWRTSGHVEGVADVLSDTKTHRLWRVMISKRKRKERLTVNDVNGMMTMTENRNERDDWTDGKWRIH
jgi:hypothetical protein